MASPRSTPSCSQLETLGHRPARLLRRGARRRAVRAARARSSGCARAPAGESAPVVLAAVDPAQPYGAALPWPERRSPREARRPARVAGRVRRADRRRADAVPRARRARRCRRSSTSDDPRLEPALSAIVEQVRAGRIKRLALEKVDGEPAIGSSAGGGAGRARVPGGPAPADAQRLSARCRGRHDRLGGEPDPPGARGPRARRDPHARSHDTRSTAGRSGWPGERSRSVDTHGKHLFLRFDGDLVIHSHLGMIGSWIVRAEFDALGGALGSCCARAISGWSSCDGPTLELMTEGRVRFDQRLAASRPGRARSPSSTPSAFIARLRADDHDAAVRRRAARPAQRRGDREHLEGRGLLGGAGRSVAPGVGGLATTRRSR